jgi:hypothetical protein
MLSRMTQYGKQDQQGNMADKEIKYNWLSNRPTVIINK